jgi:hypothetical protein
MLELGGISGLELTTLFTNRSLAALSNTFSHNARGVLKFSSLISDKKFIAFPTNSP